MVEKIRLRGMTWNHSRGYDPMVATSARFSEMHPNLTITWEKRSLQAFADRPIAEMARSYDFMVIDHPHVGEVSKRGLLVALDTLGRDAELATLSSQSVGASHLSYHYDGHQWSLAIDAATPVASFRADCIEKAPTRWDEVVDLARQGKVCFALIPINALMTFFGLARNQNIAIAENPSELIARQQGIEILDLMVEIVQLMDPRCLSLDPIGVLDWMSSEAVAPVYSPFGYGYTNYSRANYCRFPITFTDAPGIDDNGPGGTVIGGTGIAISSACKHIEIAADYAFWIAGADCQKGLYFASGGQPGNSAAWEDDSCNAASHNFFSNTRSTIENSWLRPRYAGYMRLQDEGGSIIHACLRGEATITVTLDRLNQAYRYSRK